MITKELTDVIKSLPTANGTENGVIVKDALGNQYSKPLTEFGCAARIKVNVGAILKFTSIGSVSVSTRGTNGGRCGLIWVSSYANGMRDRTTAIALWSYSSYYEWYVNGASDTKAALYLKLLGRNGEETVTATSMLGEMPKIEVVASVPSDATPLVFSTT